MITRLCLALMSMIFVGAGLLLTPATHDPATAWRADGPCHNSTNWDNLLNKCA